MESDYIDTEDFIEYPTNKLIAHPQELLATLHAHSVQKPICTDAFLCYICMLTNPQDYE